MNAKYYIYRNLHQKSFSVQYKGKVIAHPTNFIAHNCEFRVSENGRQRVLSEKQKNVHAKIACEWWEIPTDSSNLVDENNDRIYYDPYVTNQFQFSGKDIFVASQVVGMHGKDIYKKV
jgi:hypothetical protein